VPDDGDGSGALPGTIGTALADFEWWLGATWGTPKMNGPRWNARPYGRV